MKRWVTHHFEGDTLVEYNSESDMRRGKVAREYKLPHAFRGTNSVLFNGSFYYQRGGTARVGRYELATGRYDDVMLGEGGGEGQSTEDQIAYGSDNVSSCW